VHAAYQVAGLFPDGQLFLPLHGHSAGQQPGGMRCARSWRRCCSWRASDFR
jgi:hypothetical protein